MSNYISKKEWARYCNEIREAHWQKMGEIHRQANKGYRKELERLKNPPRTPVRPKEFEPPDVDDNSFADYVFQMSQGLLKEETRGEDDD